MAVGDVVSGISADNTVITFQPAVGVECMITSWSPDSLGSYLDMYDGTNQSATWSPAPASVNNLNIKIFITNSLYISLGALGAGKFGTYTGIQIK